LRWAKRGFMGVREVKKGFLGVFRGIREAYPKRA